MATLKRLLHLSAGLAVALVFVLPLYWAVVASLRQPGLPPSPAIEWWPAPAHWQNYVEIFRIVPLALYVRNSLVVVLFAVPLTLVTASWAGFALSQLPRPAQRRWLAASVVVLLIPSMSAWMFRYRILDWLGLLDTLGALIAPAVGASSPLFVLLYYWTYRRIPDEVYESARLDGAGAWTVWWEIASPLAWPTTAGVLVLAFLMYWSDFTSPVLYIYRPDLYTLPIGVQLLNQMDRTNFPLLMAGSVVMMLPVVALFVLTQRFFLHELSIGRLLEEGGY